VADDDKTRPPKPVDAPIPPVNAAIPVTRELTNAFLALESTQDRIEQVISARCEGNVQASDMENILQDVNERAIGTKALADSVEGLRPWVGRIAQNMVVDFFRRQAVQAKWLVAGVDVEELPPDPVNAPDDEVNVADVERFEAAANDVTPPKDESWTLGAWVEAEIAKRKEPHRTRDAQLLESFRYKAAHPKTTDEAVAAVFGMTRDKYKHRLATFRAHYVPIRKRYVQRRFAIIAFILLGIVALVWAFFAWKRDRPAIGADPDAKPLVATPPSASAPLPPPPERFNQAVPTRPSSPEPPGKFGPK
jgi:DNA-directed RNA polymerase specialized sigma24 family protein